MLAYLGQVWVVLLVVATGGLFFKGLRLWARHRRTAVSSPVFKAQMRGYIFWVHGLALAFLLSLVLLWCALLLDAFYLDYVAKHSATTLPIGYQLSAAWGGHEGSLLLWLVLLAGWMAVSARQGRLPLRLRLPMLVIQLGLLGAWTVFLWQTSSPFQLAPRVLNEGLGLNPLLQDWALALHPPLLYLGYAGLSVPFALVMAMLATGRIDAQRLRWLQPYLRMAWFFLTFGILLGSFWAYYELGWGGWWFWDPVENASLLPWLILTAMLHLVPQAQSQPQWLSWTFLLVIVGYGLTLLGAFLVRSGVLSSVHAFAVDPTRGRWILLMSLWVLAVALAVWFKRLDALKAHRGSIHHRDTVRLFSVPLSKGLWVFWGSVILFVMMLTVLLGTLYPLLLSQLGMGDIAVGAPYFNQVLMPMMGGLAFLMGSVSLVPTSGLTRRQWLQHLGSQLVLTGVLTLGLVGWTGALSIWPSLLMVAWIVSATGVLIWRHRHRRWRAQSWASACAHLGVAVLLLGMAANSALEQVVEVKLEPQQTVTVGGQVLRFEGMEATPGPNYLSQTARFTLNPEQTAPVLLFPERRTYLGQTMPVAEVAIDSTWQRDVYVSMGPSSPETSGWHFRIQYSPWIRAIWLGALLMLLGAMLAMRRDRDRAMVQRAIR